MSQRSSGRAPYPDGRETSANGRALNRRSAHQSSRSSSRDSAAWEDEGLDPLELDRYLEDRARLANAASPAAGVGDAEDFRAEEKGPRWSSPSRRRHREHAPVAPPDIDDHDSNRFRPPTGRSDPRADWSAAVAGIPDTHLGYGEEYDDPYFAADAVASVDHGVSPASGRPRPRARRAARPRPTVVMPKVRLPASVTGADLVHDPVALGLLGGTVVLAVVAALVAFSRVGDLPTTIELRYDAYGLPSRWGPPRSLWQLPLLIVMVTLINLVLAASVSRTDRFASRFLLAAALVVGLLAWVPLARFLW